MRSMLPTLMRLIQLSHGRLKLQPHSRASPLHVESPDGLRLDQGEISKVLIVLLARNRRHVEYRGWSRVSMNDWACFERNIG